MFLFVRLVQHTLYIAVLPFALAELQRRYLDDQWTSYRGCLSG